MEKISKSHHDLELGSAMPNIKLFRDIFIYYYYDVFKFHVQRLKHGNTETLKHINTETQKQGNTYTQTQTVAKTQLLQNCFERPAIIPKKKDPYLRLIKIFIFRRS